MSARKNEGTKETVVEEVKELTEQDIEMSEQEKAPVLVKAVITAPNENYCGKIGGVGFAAGKAELELKEENTRMLHWFQDNGYEVTYI